MWGLAYVGLSGLVHVGVIRASTHGMRKHVCLSCSSYVFFLCRCPSVPSPFLSFTHALSHTPHSHTHTLPHTVSQAGPSRSCGGIDDDARQARWHDSPASRGLASRVFVSLALSLPLALSYEIGV